MMERLTDEQLTAELDGRIALRDSYIKHGYHGTAAAYDATIMALTELKEWRMAAPQLPQPAVVDEIQKLKDGRGFKYVKDGVHYSVNYANGWNHCSAAMLQGAEPVSQPYTLRDGWVAVPVEPTESMVIAGFEAELREEFRDPEAWEAFEAMSGCEQAAHRAKLSWAAMIKAAPQQEASNRIQEERVKIQEEMAMGARLTKHRFKP